MHRVGELRIQRSMTCFHLSHLVLLSLLGRQIGDITQTWVVHGEINIHLRMLSNVHGINTSRQELRQDSQRRYMRCWERDNRWGYVLWCSTHVSCVFSVTLYTMHLTQSELWLISILHHQICLNSPTTPLRLCLSFSSAITPSYTPTENNSTNSSNHSYLPN